MANVSWTISLINYIKYEWIKHFNQIRPCHTGLKKCLMHWCFFQQSHILTIFKLNPKRSSFEMEYPEPIQKDARNWCYLMFWILKTQLRDLKLLGKDKITTQENRMGQILQSVSFLWILFNTSWSEKYKRRFICFVFNSLPPT